MIENFTGIVEICDGWYEDIFKTRSVFYEKGKISNLNGPAIMWGDGAKSWWLNNELYDYKMEQWKIEVEKLKKSRLFLK